MKQNTLWFWTAAILAIFALMGVPYMIPHLEGVPYDVLYSESIDWDLLNDRMTYDTGLELVFPIFSLIPFMSSAVIFSATKRLRVLIFLQALINIMFVISIPLLLAYFIEAPYYRYDNGYYLHVIASIILVILGIINLKPHDKTRKSKEDLALLDDII